MVLLEWRFTCRYAVHRVLRTCQHCHLTLNDDELNDSRFYCVLLQTNDGRRLYDPSQDNWVPPPESESSNAVAMAVGNPINQQQDNRAVSGGQSTATDRHSGAVSMAVGGGAQVRSSAQLRRRSHESSAGTQEHNLSQQHVADRDSPRRHDGKTARPKSHGDMDIQRQHHPLYPPDHQRQAQHGDGRQYQHAQQHPHSRQFARHADQPEPHERPHQHPQASHQHPLPHQYGGAQSQWQQSAQQALHRNRPAQLDGDHHRSPRPQRQPTLPLEPQQVTHHTLRFHAAGQQLPERVVEHAHNVQQQDVRKDLAAVAPQSRGTAGAPPSTGDAQRRKQRRSSGTSTKNTSRRSQPLPPPQSEGISFDDEYADDEPPLPPPPPRVSSLKRKPHGGGSMGLSTVFEKDGDEAEEDLAASTARSDTLPAQPTPSREAALDAAQAISADPETAQTTLKMLRALVHHIVAPHSEDLHASSATQASTPAAVRAPERSPQNLGSSVASTLSTASSMGSISSRHDPVMEARMARIEKQLVQLNATMSAIVQHASSTKGQQ